MEPRRTQRLPFQSDLYRVIRENCLLFIVTLVQANASTFFKVYGRDYFYGTTSLSPTYELYHYYRGVGSR